MAPRRTDPDRLFVRDGWRHYRRTYSLGEVRWGFAVLAGLIAMTAWVAWRGQNPDPSIFGEATPSAAAGAGAVASRGALPSALGTGDWTEGTVSQFDAENLYVKINGRADYFLGFGFQRLDFVALSRAVGTAEVTIDVELYDLGTPANAVGAFAGERQAGEEPTRSAGSLSYRARNALYMARGQYYLRAIGSEESPEVTAQLDQLRARMESELEGEALPWAFELFGALGVTASKISYQPENAFSFAFANDVYAARLADDSQMFAVARADAAAARGLAAQFAAGFAQLGEPLAGGEAGGATWIKDRYLGQLSTAVARDQWVLGIRAAPDIESARASLQSLERALADLPAEVRARAAAGAMAPTREAPVPPAEEPAAELPEGQTDELPEEY